MKEFITGVNEASKKVNCKLIGGETAEMPGIYKQNCYDFVGTMIGREKYIFYGVNIGDIAIALPSSGPHTNGYTLIRKILEEHEAPKEIMKKLMNTHMNYLDEIKLIVENNVIINGLSHITGGGLIDNPKRILGENMLLKMNEKEIMKNLPEPFKWLKEKGGISDEEMLRVFNCGIGMIIFVKDVYYSKIKELLDYCYILGKVEKI